MPLVPVVLEVATMLPAAATSPFGPGGAHDMQSGPIVHVAVLVDLGLPEHF